MAFRSLSRFSLSSGSVFSNLRNYSRAAPVKDKIDKMVRANKLVLFMKGTPQEPMCGFSRAVCQIFAIHGVPNDKFNSHNVLEDEELRQGIKEYSNWPTIPQIYVDGEFVGGCDIMLDMHKSGELVEELKKIGIISKLS